jgi:acetylglutamate kinase
VKVLIKLGGTLLEEPSVRNSLAQELAAVRRDHELVVVHGGGKQVTLYLDARGVKSQFVGGLRVSGEEVIDAVTKVIAGTVNKQLVTALVAAGVQAVGLSGLDGPLTLARPLDPNLGFVGQPQKTDGRLLQLLLEGGYTPVIACIAGDEHGNIYNVNADQMAVSCAAGLGADRLLFLTDVPGVKDAGGEVISVLTQDDCVRLVAAGIARGGMQAKLDAAQVALQAGVAEVWIAPGREPNICARLLAASASAPTGCGTKVIAN